MQELLTEWYLRYFTGTPVQIADTTATLPALSTDQLYFGQVQMSQPSEISTLHTVFTDIRNSQSVIDRNKVRVFGNVSASVTVRRSYPAKGKSTADWEVRKVADWLAQLFRSEKHALAQKGLRHAAVLRGPNAVSSNLYATRLLLLSFQLQFEATV